MLEYNKIDLSEGIDIVESLSFRECGLCHFHYFIKNFNYQDYFCDGCHDMSMKAVSINNLAIVYSKGNAYRVNFSFMTKDEKFIKLIKRSDLNNKRGVL